MMVAEQLIDGRIIEACQQGDRAAFQLLFETYKDKVFSIAVYSSGDRALADDITQQIFLKLFTAEERKSYFAEFLLDDFVKGDLSTRMEAYSKAIAARILSPNEARAAENRAPYPEGDKFENPNTTTGAAA